jgi:phosphate transport system permease protein
MAANIAVHRADIEAIRAIIGRARRRDVVFGLIGILALMIGVLTFTALFVDMAIQGVPRLDWKY